MAEDRERILVLETYQKSMMNKLDEIHKDLKSFKAKCDRSYASKEELENNKERIDRIENILDKLTIGIIGVVSFGILVLGSGIYAAIKFIS